MKILTTLASSVLLASATPKVFAKQHDYHAGSHDDIASIDLTGVKIPQARIQNLPAGSLDFMRKERDSNESNKRPERIEKIDNLESIPDSFRAENKHHVHQDDVKNYDSKEHDEKHHKNKEHEEKHHNDKEHDDKHQKYKENDEKHHKSNEHDDHHHSENGHSHKKRQHSHHVHHGIFNKRNFQNETRSYSTTSFSESIGSSFSSTSQSPSTSSAGPKSDKCKFPTDAGLIAVTPENKNAGWALSPDQECHPGKYCPYACPPGQVMAQWDPSATSYTYPMSLNGGLFCDEGGIINKPFPDKPYCVPGSGSSGVRNTASGVVAFCQTVLPGNEAMIIPNEIAPGASAEIAVPGISYWLSTAAHYYVNSPGIPASQACVWGSKENPKGNWSPYVAGANTDAAGETFVKLSWNPVYMEPSNSFSASIPSFGVRVVCEGNCTGIPCAIDPAHNGVNQVTTANGNAEFCVATALKGSKIHFEVFDKDSPSPPASLPSSVLSSSASSSSSSLSVSSSSTPSFSSSSTSTSSLSSASLHSWSSTSLASSSGIFSTSASPSSSVVSTSSWTSTTYSSQPSMSSYLKPRSSSHSPASTSTSTSQSFSKTRKPDTASSQVGSTKPVDRTTIAAAPTSHVSKVPPAHTTSHSYEHNPNDKEEEEEKEIEEEEENKHEDNEAHDGLQARSFASAASKKHGKAAKPQETSQKEDKEEEDDDEDEDDEDETTTVKSTSTHTINKVVGTVTVTTTRKSLAKQTASRGPIVNHLMMDDVQNTHTMNIPNSESTLGIMARAASSDSSKSNGQSSSKPSLSHTATLSNAATLRFSRYGLEMLIGINFVIAVFL